MKKTWIVIVLIVAAVLGGYAWWQAQNAKVEADMAEPVMPATETAPDASTADTATQEATETGEAATEESGTVLDQAAGAVNDAADAAAGAASDAAEAVTDAAEGAMEAAGEAASDAADAATDAAEGAMDAAGDMASDAADAVNDAMTGASDAASSMSDLLTVDTFDATKLVEMVQTSNLGEMQKTTLVTAIEQAGQNPDLIPSVIEQVKQALGQ